MASKCDLGIFPFLLTPQVARQARVQQENGQNLRKPLQESAVNQIQKVTTATIKTFTVFQVDLKQTVLQLLCKYLTSL